MKFIASLDVSPLSERLQDDNLFGKYQWRKEKYAHKEMKDIWVRYNHPDNIGEHFNDDHNSVWYPIINDIPEVIPICFALMAIVMGERLGGVLITKLPPGGRIEKHVDSGWHAGFYQKFFVPIQNDPGAKFCWDHIEIDPRPGEIWEFENNIPHWVVNDSQRDRIAMIVCIKVFNEFS